MGTKKNHRSPSPLYSPGQKRISDPHKRDLPIGTLRSIEKQANIKLKEMMKYIALIHKEEDSDYGVSFPDFPGCISAGLTLEQAKTMGMEVSLTTSTY